MFSLLKDTFKMVLVRIDRALARSLACRGLRFMDLGWFPIIDVYRSNYMIYIC